MLRAWLRVPPGLYPKGLLGNVAASSPNTEVFPGPRHTLPRGGAGVQEPAGAAEEAPPPRRQQPPGGAACGGGGPGEEPPATAPGVCQQQGHRVQTGEGKCTKKP